MMMRRKKVENQENVWRRNLKVREDVCDSSRRTLNDFRASQIEKNQYLKLEDVIKYRAIKPEQ